MQELPGRLHANGKSSIRTSGRGCQEVDVGNSGLFALRLPAIGPRVHTHARARAHSREGRDRRGRVEDGHR
ncbi:Hypp5006 [Branchiostoma lanceolatum]|uniref:Hypp5006 protein n=1 Tax=Branchiostoma lanceolatum TaxID=7740 RepID=A0A8K0AED9_BRALA|nr:Hypp5006 [Branchiostoma lanceolatum]